MLKIESVFRESLKATPKWRIIFLLIQNNENYKTELPVYAITDRNLMRDMTWFKL